MVSTAILLSPRAAILAAAILHVVVTLSIFSVGRLGVFPSQFDRDGIGEFAGDGRLFRDQAVSLADLLTEGKIASWVDAPAPFHVKLVSLDFVVMRPLWGSNILATEPLSLFYYLAMLTCTFRLTRTIAGQRAAWLASAIVGLWPSLMLHSTQLLRDPLLIVAILALVLVLAQLLTRTYERRSALTAATIGALACFVIWKCRQDIWPVIMAVISLAVVLFMIGISRERKLAAWNLIVIALLCVMVIGIPETLRNPPRPIRVIPDSILRKHEASFWGRIGATRDQFILENREGFGSAIDQNDTLSDRDDVMKYIPRALALGYLAPFPTMWMTPGHTVGWIGRLLSGLEMSLTYVIEALACVFMWRNRRRPVTWLLVLTPTLGVLALGLVLVNVGTLYRMRYPFWILLVILAAATLETRGSGHDSHPSRHP